MAEPLILVGPHGLPLWMIDRVYQYNTSITNINKSSKMSLAIISPGIS